MNEADDINAAIRQNAFQLMALRTLPTALTDEDDANLNRLTSQVNEVCPKIGTIA
jgi:hypothetical protein